MQISQINIVTAEEFISQTDFKQANVNRSPLASKIPKFRLARIVVEQEIKADIIIEIITIGRPNKSSINGERRMRLIFH